MNTLKKVSFLLLFFAGSIGICQGQNALPEMKEEEKTELQENFKMLVESLALSEEQKPAFIEISKKYGAQLLSLKDSGAGKFSKYRQFKSINKSRNKEMKKLLSKDQYKVYLEEQEKMQKKMKAAADKA